MGQMPQNNMLMLSNYCYGKTAKWYETNLNIFFLVGQDSKSIPLNKWPLQQTLRDKMFFL